MASNITVSIREPIPSEDDDDTSSISEEENVYRRDIEHVDFTQEYWNIQKQVKYLRAGNSTVTLIAIIGLKECGLQKESAQQALCAAGGITILLNILRTSALSCLIGTLQVLEMACRTAATKAAVHHSGGVQALQGLLHHPDLEVRGPAALVLARVCTLSAARISLIKNNGIQTLIPMLKLKGSIHSGKAVEGAAHALWACSNSKEGRLQLLRGGIVQTIGKLLHKSNDIILIPVVGILHRCLVQRLFREKIKNTELISHLIKLMKSNSPYLQCLSVKSLARATILESTRNRLVAEGGLSTVVSLMITESKSFIQQLCLPPKHPARRVSFEQTGDIRRENEPTTETPEPNEEEADYAAVPLSEPSPSDVVKEVKRKPSIVMSEEETIEMQSDYVIDDGDLIEALTGILSQVAKSASNIKKLLDLKAVPILIALLQYPDEMVITNVVGALEKVILHQEGCQYLIEGDGVSRLLELLQGNSDSLLLNVTRALDSCAQHPDGLNQILKLEGLRLLWSHLKSPNERIQASAANAICTCLQQEKEGLAEIVRSLVGGIELLVALLESPCEAVLSAVCAAIARIANDSQNLAIMTDYGAVACLSKLAVRENDTLRPYLAEAIAACCVSRETGLLFGQAGAVSPLVQYLETNESKIRRPTCRALHRLSLEPENCVTLHQSGAVKLLLEMLGSEDTVVQDSAADCLRNIRLLALQRCKERDTDAGVFKVKPNAKLKNRMQRKIEA